MNRLVMYYNLRDRSWRLDHCIFIGTTLKVHGFLLSENLLYLNINFDPVMFQTLFVPFHV